VSAASVLRLKVILNDVKPRVLRKIEVPADITLDWLHLTLQAAFGWENVHCFAIHCGDQRWGIPDPESRTSTMRDAREVRLGDLLEAFGAKRLRYVYDFGDNWEHTITIGKACQPKSGELYPRLVAAEGRCPPEDVGGPWGYFHILESLKDPSPEQREEFVMWYGEADFDPENFQPELLKQHVMAIAQEWSE